MRKKNYQIKNEVHRLRALRATLSVFVAMRSTTHLRKIDPFVFEELLLNAFELKGYKVIRNKKYTGDGGIDGIVYDHHGNKILIQAKRYSSYINPKHVATFQLLLPKKKAVKGFFIHTGKTSPGTRDQFRHSNIILIGGSKLLDLIKQPLV